jgi:FkbM family methyltransferase
MFAAQLGRDVVAIEPFYDNVMRIHKSVGLANLQERVTLVKNTLFNKRHELKRLSRFDTNKGGQQVDANSKIDHKNKTDLLDQDKYIVETILMDDLIEAFPLRRDGQFYKKACIKMDIEGSEPFAFQQASSSSTQSV